MDKWQKLASDEYMQMVGEDRTAVTLFKEPAWGRSGPLKWTWEHMDEHGGEIESSSSYFDSLEEAQEDAEAHLKKYMPKGSRAEAAAKNADVSKAVALIKKFIQEAKTTAANYERRASLYSETDARGNAFHVSSKMKIEEAEKLAQILAALGAKATASSDTNKVAQAAASAIEAKVKFQLDDGTEITKISFTPGKGEADESNYLVGKLVIEGPKYKKSDNGWFFYDEESGISWEFDKLGGVIDEINEAYLVDEKATRGWGPFRVKVIAAIDRNIKASIALRNIPGLPCDVEDLRSILRSYAEEWEIYHAEGDSIAEIKKQFRYIIIGMIEGGIKPEEFVQKYPMDGQPINFTYTAADKKEAFKFIKELWKDLY